METLEAKAARIPNQEILELRLLVRHHWRLVDLVGDLQRFALTLIERVFPEYPGVFSSPWIRTSYALIREIGMTPRQIVAQIDDVSQLISHTSRNRIHPEKIQTLFDRAKHSIGIRTAEEVIVEQLRSTLRLIETVHTQQVELGEQLRARVDQLNSPLLSMGIGIPLIATIHAESDPIQDFRHVWQYVAYTGLDPFTYESGKSQKGTRTRISKRGSPYLRRGLYMAAMGSYRHKKDLQRCYQRSRRTGHHHNAAMTIVAHKLARIVWRLLIDNRPYRKAPPKRKRGVNPAHPKKSLDSS